MNLFSSSKISPPVPVSAPTSMEVKTTLIPSSCKLIATLQRGRKGGLKRLDLRKGKVSLELREARRKTSLLSDEPSLTDRKQSEMSSSEAAMASLAGSLISPLQEYEFRLVNSGGATAAAGVWNFAVKFDPTAAAEWSSLSALFTEYKLVGAKITFAAQWVQTASGISVSGPYLACGANMGQFGTNPGSIATAMEPSNSKLINLLGGSPHSQYEMSVKVTDLDYQIVGSAGTPYAGAYGQFGCYGTDVSSSTATVSYVYELFVVMRARG